MMLMQGRWSNLKERAAHSAPYKVGTLPALSPLYRPTLEHIVARAQFAASSRKESARTNPAETFHSISRRFLASYCSTFVVVGRFNPSRFFRLCPRIQLKVTRCATIFSREIPAGGEETGAMHKREMARTHTRNPMLLSVITIR